MKTFKQFMEQTVPPKSDIDIVPRSGDIDRGRYAFGLGRKKNTMDFHLPRFRARNKAGKPAENTNQRAPEYNYHQIQNTRGPREIRFRDPKDPTGFM